MKIAVIGGGPGGLYFSALMKQLDPSHEITVWERNAPEDTFGFGVVFSDQTLSGIVASDRDVFEDMGDVFAYWDDVDVEIRGERFSIGGNGFAAMSRKDLLKVLQRRAVDKGVTIHFSTDAPPVEELMAEHDLVVASDGINSAIRGLDLAHFGATEDWRSMKYIWLGTDTVYDAFKFFIKESEWGVMQVHAYPMDDQSSTFIVEMDEDVWRRAGFDKVDAASLPPGVSDEESIERLRGLWADVLEGGDLLANNSKWISFRTVRVETAVKDNLVLVGDAAHSAHFSIGSGTKLAMEDALALAACLGEQPTIESALKAFDDERQTIVKSTQRSAQASLEWFEELAQYVGQDNEQFVFNLMTRSRRITYGNLQERDPKFMARVDEWLLRDQQESGRVPTEGDFAVPAGQSVPPMFLPFTIKGRTLRNRVVVSAMDMYSSVDGVPGDFHLVHLGSRAMGGAALVMTEMVCVSPEGRITPGCGGLWTDEQQEAWSRIVAYGHDFGALMGCQARPLRPQGLDEAHVGRDRPAPARGKLAAHRAVADPLPRWHLPGAARDDARGHGLRARRLRGGRPACRSGGLRCPRVALRPRLPAVRLPHAREQPAHRRIWRLVGEPVALPARGVRRRQGGVARGPPSLRACLGNRLGPGRAQSGGLHRHRRGLRRARCRRH